MTDKLYWEVKKYIRANGITMEELAKKLGYTRCYFSSVLNKGIESIKVEQKLMAFLNDNK